MKSFVTALISSEETKSNLGTHSWRLYHYIRKRNAGERFDRFLRANAELLEEVRFMGHFEDASEVGLDTTGIPWFGIDFLLRLKAEESQALGY